jgi:FkbM family methyltransferase
VTRPAFGQGKDWYFRELGRQPRGTVHVGVNNGQEVGWYLSVGQVPVLGFEPHPDVFGEALESFAPEVANGSVSLFNLALGEQTGQMPLFVPRRVKDGVEAHQGSSGLPEIFLAPEYEIGRELTVSAWRFDDWAGVWDWDLRPYDLLVIDVQGMELQVLQGCGDLLAEFSYLMVELSDPPIYFGEASASEICAWLDERGWRQVTPISGHNDVLFMRDA